jgi:hypothetical protein
MKKSLVIALIVCSALVGSATPLLAQENAPPAAHVEAAALIEQKAYDQAIRLLEGPAAEDPYKFEPNWLLGTALLETCEQMKAAGNPGYRHLIKRPYEIGLRLYKAQPSRPEPYYLIARSLTLNDRPHKAGNWILKAIHFSSPQHQSYPDFQMVLGDSWTGQMEQGNPRGYARGREAYHMARDLRKGDPDFVARIERRLETLEKKRK